MRQYQSGGGSPVAGYNAMSNEFKNLLNKPLRAPKERGPVMSNGFYNLLYRNGEGQGSVPKSMRRRDAIMSRSLLRGLLRRVPITQAIDAVGMVFGPSAQIADPAGYSVLCDMGIPATHGPKLSSGSPLCGLDAQALGTPATSWTGVGYVALKQTGFTVPRGMVVKQWVRNPGAVATPVRRKPVGLFPARPTFPQPLPPPLTFQPPARPLPWALLPTADPGAGTGAGNEGSSASNGNAAAPRPDPARTPDLIVTIKGHEKPRFDSKPPGHKNERPPRGQPERKMKLALAGIAQRIVGMATEGLDWLAVIHGSLPKECRAKPTLRNGKWVASTPQAKMTAIYKHWDCINVAKLFLDAGYMQVSDAAWGKLGQSAGKAAAHIHKHGYGSPAVGFQFGDWDTFAFDSAQTAVKDMKRPRSAPRPNNVGGNPKCKEC